MSGVLDFLFEGKPPESITTYGSTSESMPRWLSDYTQGLITRANAVAGEPYQAYGGPRLANVGNDTMRSYGAVRSTVDQANQNFGTLLQSPGALAAAQPYINKAGQGFPGSVDQYMNPYVSNVIGRSTTLANRALNEQFLPSLAAKFGSRGSDARSSAYRRAADRGVRDVTEGLQEQANAQLANAYNSAAQTFGQDANRFAGLAGTVGNLATDDMVARGTLAESAQSAGLRGAAALDTIGRAQQGDEQQSLDLAYQDFQDQRDYPRSTVDWMNSVIRGLPYDRNIATTDTSPPDAFGPSPLSQLASLGTGIAGIWQAFKKARGGPVRRGYSRGSLVRGTLGRAQDNTHLTTVREADLVGAIEKLQGRQRRLRPDTPEWAELSETLQPLFEEMARRQREVPIGKFRGGRAGYSRGGRVSRGTI